MTNLPLGDSATFYLAVQDKAQPQNPDGSYPAKDLTGYSVRGVIFQRGTYQQIATFSGVVTNAGGGLATLTLDSSTSAGVPRGTYDLRLEIFKTGVQLTVVEDTLVVA